MLHAIILTALLSGTTESATAVDVPSAVAELPPPAAAVSKKEGSIQDQSDERRIEIRMDSVTFSANSLRVLDSKAAERNEATSQETPGILVLEGEARCSIAEGDVVIVADTLHVELDGPDSTSIAGFGGCEYVDGEGHGIKAAAEKILLNKDGLAFEGSVYFECPNGTAVTADAIRTSCDRGGKFQIHAVGTTTLTLDD